MTNNKIQAYAERIERLMDERELDGIDIKDIYAEVKSAGFNAKALRKVIADKRRKADAQLEADIDAYKVALGIALVRDDGLSLREAEKISGASKSSIHRGLSVPKVSQDDEALKAVIAAEYAAEVDRRDALLTKLQALGQEIDGPGLTIPAHLRRERAA